MMTNLLLGLAIAAALVASAFCSGAETAFMSVSRGRVLHLVREGSAAARLVQRAIGSMNSTLTTLLIANNLANVAFSAAAAALGARLCGDAPVARGAWTFASAFTVLYLCEFLPKLFCSMRPLRRSLSIAPVYHAVAALFAPLTAAAMMLTNLFVPRPEPREKTTMNDILRILQDRKDGVKLTDFEASLVERILELRKSGIPLTVENVLGCDFLKRHPTA